MKKSMYVSLDVASQTLGISVEQLYRMGVAGHFRLYKDQPLHEKGGDGYETVESLIFDEDVFDEGDEPEADEDPENLYYFKLYGKSLLIREVDFQKMVARCPPTTKAKPDMQTSAEQSTTQHKTTEQTIPQPVENVDPTTINGMVKLKAYFSPATWSTIKGWLSGKGVNKPPHGGIWKAPLSVCLEIMTEKEEFIGKKRKNIK